MKSKASYFSPSLPLFKENLKRFWALSALSFLVYFFALTFPVLMKYGKLNEMWDYIYLSLHNANPFFLAALGFFPVMAAVLLLNYLHSPNAVTAMHTMPFTRHKLFVTNVLSGLFLLAVPIIANGLILLCLSKPVTNAELLKTDYYSTNYFGFAGIPSHGLIEAFSRTDILAWIGISLVAVVFIYAVSLLAGMVTGNVLMHFAMACTFNFAVPGLLGVGIVYCSHYLTGYMLSETTANFIYGFSPLLKLFTLSMTGDAGFLSLKYISIYLLVSIILMVLTCLLYEKRKLERAGDTLVYAFMRPIICYVITFLGMTAFGFALTFSINDGDRSNLFLYMGFAIGAVLAFIIGQMIVKKTLRIFNLKSLRGFAIYAIIAVAFVAAFQFDVTGYEKKVPEIADAESAYLSNSFINSSGSVNSWDGMTFKDPESIEAIQGFHREVVKEYASGNYPDSYLLSTDDSVIPLELSYDFGKGEQYARAYNVSREIICESENLKTLYESREYKESVLHQNVKEREIVNITLINDAFEENKEVTIAPEQRKEFLENIDEDIMVQSFDDMVSRTNAYCHGNIYYENKSGVDIYGRYHYGNNELSISVPRTFSNTLNWLQDHGYAAALENTGDNVEKIVLSKDGLNLEITDIEEINELAKTYEYLTGDPESSYISGEIFYKTKVNSYNGNSEEYHKTAIAYSEGNVPDFILKKFEESNKN